MTEDFEKGLEKLIVWQKAIQFASYICGVIVKKIPEDEKWALISQLRRSSQSVPANIAEGYGRYYYQEGVRFAYIARGSLQETYSHLTYAKEMEYFSSDEFDHSKKEIAELMRLLNGYINYLKRTKRGINEPGAQYFAHPDIEIEEVSPAPAP
jgi:four helix bundle protein